MDTNLDVGSGLVRRPTPPAATACLDAVPRGVETGSVPTSSAHSIRLPPLPAVLTRPVTTPTRTRAVPVDLKRVDLNLLVACEALVTERSVTRAAQQLNVGQPAMSATLARLRKLLGDPVLVREGRGYVTTPFAESLLGPIRAILFDIEKVLALCGDFNPAADARTFSLLLADCQFALTILHQLRTRLRTFAPQVDLRIEPPSHDNVERVHRLEVDLLVAPIDTCPGYESLPHHILCDDRYSVVADIAHPDIDKAITVEQFTTLPYLATSSGPTCSTVESQLDALGVTRNIEMTAEWGIAPFLIQGTRLITVLRERVAREFAERTPVKLLTPPMTMPTPTREIMLWTKRSDQDPAHQWLRRLVVDVAA
ncbi:LysR family transcriptional regulator [Mycolicibacterium lutetiense]